MENSRSFLTLIATPSLPAESDARVEGALLPVLGEGFEKDPRAESGFAGAVGEELIRVVGMADPIPAEVLAGPARGAWYWPEATEAFADHRAHLIAVVKGPTQPAAEKREVMRALILSRITSLLLRAFGGIGVFWAGAPAVHSATAFLESTDDMTPDRLPLRLWVDFQVWQNDDGTHSLRTSGMESFGRHELEIHGSTKGPDEVASWAYNVAHYILGEGVEVEDGHAVGRSPSEWIRVHHTPSIHDPERTVYYLDLEAER